MITFIKRSLSFIVLFATFLEDLVVSSLQVAKAVLSPNDITKPRLVTIPLDVTTDAGITMVANFISLTPGTLSIDVSDDRKTLLVHDLLGGDSSEQAREDARTGIQARVLKVTGK